MAGNRRRTLATMKRKAERRAAAAIAAGRTPGKVGQPKRLLTEAAEKAAAKARQKRWRDRNADHVRARDVASSAKRRAKLKAEDPATYRIYMQANAAKMRAKKAAIHTPKGLTAIVRRVWDRAAGCCEVCRTAGPLELDHILAVANGGTNDETNLQFLCLPCNRSKGKSDFQTWLQSRPELEGAAA